MIVSPRRREQEGGQVLVLALVFLIVFGVLMAMMLGLVGTNLETTIIVRSRTTRGYAADAGIESAIQRIRLDSSACATETPMSLPSQTVNGRTATVTCQLSPGSGFPQGASGWAAIITDDLDMQAGGTAAFNGPVYVGGHIFGGEITDTNGSVYQHSSTCPGSLHQPAGLTVTPSPPYSWQCTTMPPPDPPHVLPPAPGAPKAPDTYGTCRVFYPGKYTSAPALLTDNYFVSGVYYFEDIGTWNIPNGKTLVGGSNPSDTNPITTPCKANADGVPGGGGSGFGVEWIFGGSSRIASGNNDTIELHARVPGPDESGVTPRVSFVAVPHDEPGYLASHPFFGNLLNLSSGHPAVAIHGLFYAPTTDILLDGPNGSSVFRGGAVMHDIHIKLSAAVEPNPIFTLGTVATAKHLVVITSTASHPGSAPVEARALVEVRNNTSPPTIVVHSWRTY